MDYIRSFFRPRVDPELQSTISKLKNIQTNEIFSIEKRIRSIFKDLNDQELHPIYHRKYILNEINEIDKEIKDILSIISKNFNNEEIENIIERIYRRINSINIELIKLRQIVNKAEEEAQKITKNVNKIKEKLDKYYQEALNIDFSITKNEIKFQNIIRSINTELNKLKEYDIPDIDNYVNDFENVIDQIVNYMDVPYPFENYIGPDGIEIEFPFVKLMKNGMKQIVYRYHNIRTDKVFYEIVRKEAKLLDRGNIHSFVVRFIRKNFNPVSQGNIMDKTKDNKYITIKYPAYSTEELFFKKIEEIRTKKFEDTDYYQKSLNNPMDIDNNVFKNNKDFYSEDNLEDFTFDYTYFTINYEYPIRAGSFSDDMVFLTENIRSNNNICIQECFKILNSKYNENFEIPKVDNLTHLIDFLKEKNYPVEILENKISSVDSFKKENLEIQDIELYPSIYIPEHKKYKLIYDQINRHIDVIKDNILTVDPNIHFDHKYNTCKNEKIIHKSDRGFTADELQSLKNTQKRYIFFDFETVEDITKSSNLLPYSLNILFIKDETMMEYLEYADSDSEKMEEFRKKNAKTFFGFDCVKQFVKYFHDLERTNLEKTFVLIGFNNANFDNIILFSELLMLNTENCEVSNPFFVGSSLLKFYINRRHEVWDLRKHLTQGSLKDNCKYFNLKHGTKRDFDHHVLNKYYNQLDKIPADLKSDIIIYGQYDVIATALIFNRYIYALKSCEVTQKYAKNITQYSTLPSLIYKIFENHMSTISTKFYEKPKVTCNAYCKKGCTEACKKRNKFVLPQLPLKLFSDIHSYKVGGRVECPQGKQYITEPVVSVDVSSSYAHSMVTDKVYYPCGDIVKTNSYFPGKLGFYYVDVDQSYLIENKLPLIYPVKLTGDNIWNHNQILENYCLNTVDIEFLMENKCKVTLHPQEDGHVGYYFTEKIRSIDLFKFYVPIMKLKNEQYRLRKTPDHNQAMETVYKLLLCSLSGKLNEHLYTKQTVMINSLSKYYELKENNVGFNTINVFGNEFFVNYSLPLEKLGSLKQKPIFLGSFIYSYSRRHMYQYAYCVPSQYTDTDSSTQLESDHKIWEEKMSNTPIPHWEDIEEFDPRYKYAKIYQKDFTVFGSFKIELDNRQNPNPLYICIDKKLCYSNTNTEEEMIKSSGINKSSILLKSEDEIKECSTTQIQEIMNETIRSFKNNAKQIFIDIYNNKKIYFLTETFHKSFDNRLQTDHDDYDNHNKNALNIQIKRYIIEK